MTRFSTDQLTTFATVIEYGTFDAAADIPASEPSAISQRIKAMEQIAGKVLVRRSNPVTPTDAGQSVLRIARQSEFLQQEMERELMGAGGFQSVSVAVNADSLATWFLDAVGTLSREDSIFCDLRREGEFHSSAMLRSGEVMAVITSNPKKSPAAPSRPSAWHATGALPPPTTYSGTCRLAQDHESRRAQPCPRRRI